MMSFDPITKQITKQKHERIIRIIEKIIDNKNLEQISVLEYFKFIKSLQIVFEYDKNRIFKNLQEKIKELKLVEPYINEGKKFAKNLNNDIKRYRSINADILKTLKKISTNYLVISSELTNKSKILDFIVIADKIDLDYEMKMMRELTVDSVLNLNQKMIKFYENIEKRIQEIERLANESINTTS